MRDKRFHRFCTDVSGIALPARFTYPMHYVPHELSKIAACEVMDYAMSRDEWHDELAAGKMLGVLVAQDHEGELGYLAAYSGNLCHTGEHDYFVPHVYNLLDPHGLFRQGEDRISEINHRIDQMETSPELQRLRHEMNSAINKFKEEEKEMRAMMEHSKAERDKRREEGNVTAEEEALMVKESQFQKAELRRIKKRHNSELERLSARLDDYHTTINQLKKKRKTMSEALQRQLFDLFVLNNAKGETCSVATIFDRSLHRLPPGGTGDCCAPKLLQYAYLHGLKPVCMAEFWVGQSPLGEVRHHGHFYPACRSKCKPLLEFMLQGLDVEDNVLQQSEESTLNIIFEDEWLIVVDKPAGMLTVPGKDEGSVSLLELVGKKLPEHEMALEVHRLDQATSGLVIIAKTKQAQKLLRQQFEEQLVSKTYIALLDGTPEHDKGVIDLPLRLNPNDRPRQMVDSSHGKRAITEYQVLERRGNRTLVEFHPLTGRTHQLRVHASHPLGLNCPIVGDMLYGTASDRLYLHAQSLSFTHPITGAPITLATPPPF